MTHVEQDSVLAEDSLFDLAPALIQKNWGI